MDQDTAIEVRFALPEGQEVPALSYEGVEVSREVSSDRGILPLAALLVVLVPSGLALLAKVTNDIVHSWKDDGVLIDGRGETPTVTKQPGIPYGTIVILTSDGEKAVVENVPQTDVGSYIAGALKALAGGATAGKAKAAGAAAQAASAK